MSENNERDPTPRNENQSAQSDADASARSENSTDVVGRGGNLDPRIFAYREDLAAQSLYGRVSAPKYVAGEKRQVVRAAIALRKLPAPNAALETEALFGEQLTVYDAKNGWAWVQLARDNYVGYLPADTISADVNVPTHWVRATGTFVYPQPDIKSPPILHLSLTSEIALKDAQQNAPSQFSELKSGGFVLKRHLAPVGTHARDFVEVAERLVETPYLWGGRTRIGIDCSGLVQVALQAAGIEAPRDSDLQQKQLGEPVEINAALDSLERGDLVFWDGHVGIMVDGVMMVHANAHHMATAVEPLPEAASRIARDNGPIRAIKRLKSLGSAPKHA